MSGPNSEKLSQLRAKTDRQIVRLFRMRLDDGLRYAAAAETECAEQAFEEAQKLWAVMRPEHKPLLRGRLDELREAVERIRLWREPRWLRAASML